MTAALRGYQTTAVALHTVRPVYIVYFTVEVGSNGQIVRHDDPYGRDARLNTTLANLDINGRTRTALAAIRPVGKSI